MGDPGIPFIDEHARIVAAPPERAWEALLRVVPRAFSGAATERYARLIRCEPAAPDGRFPEVGAAIAGFRVARVDAPRELALVGRHRFSEYALMLRVDALDDGRASRVAARTHASFPGAAGRLYRAAIIGTRGHVLVVKRLLRATARRAER